jgi:hypothetical protein
MLLFKERLMQSYKHIQLFFLKPVTCCVSLNLRQVHAGNQVGVVLKPIVPAALGIKTPITFHYHGVFQGLNSAVTCSSFYFIFTLI